MSFLSKDVFACLEGETEVVCKETCNTLCGKGVKLMKVISPEDIMSELSNHKSKNFMLQEKVIQHPFFDQFNPTSANIIRIITWRYEGEINVLSASIRFGIKGSFTDRAFVDGKEIANVVGIDNDGYVKDRFVSFDGNIADPPLLTDKKVPSWDLLLEMVKKAHNGLLFFDFVAWDFMIDKNGNPICIEYNIKWPGTILYQYANGPLAGEYTDKFLDFLKENTPVAIPRFFRK